MLNQGELRLSAQRAFLGRIHPEMRLVKIKALGTVIVLSIVVGSEPNERLREDVSDAMTEIIADFPQATEIEERFEINSGSISGEDVLSEGWLFRRAE
jgi:hypothetical protein